MVARQEHQVPGVFAVDDAAVGLVQQGRVKQLAAQGFFVIDKDPAGLGGAGGAQRRLGAVYGLEAFRGGRRLRQLLLRPLADTGEPGAFRRADQPRSPRLAQKVSGHFVPVGRVQQQGVGPGENDRPVQNGPFRAGVQLQGDIAVRRHARLLQGVRRRVNPFPELAVGDGLGLLIAVQIERLHGVLVFS